MSSIIYHRNIASGDNVFYTIIAVSIQFGHYWERNKEEKKKRSKYPFHLKKKNSACPTLL